MSKLEQLKEKAKGLEAKDPKRAVEIWLDALNNQDDTNPDLSIYNRIGDLYIKLRDPAQAADYYDQAVDKYAELGFHNNAIAMCNKVLRNAPARQTTYLKLAKLYAAKGFIAEAKQNFVEYAERMQKVGKIDHAFAALKEFTDISPESANLREMLSHVSLAPAHPRGWGSLYAALAHGRVTRQAVRDLVARYPLADGSGATAHVAAHQKTQVRATASARTHAAATASQRARATATHSTTAGASLGPPARSRR